MAKKKKQEVKKSTLSRLRKKYAGSGLGSEVLLPPEKQLWIPSQFLRLNHLTGGGIPYGKMAEFHGTESSGKSAEALDFAYSVQQLGGIVLWADVEHSFTDYWAEANGLDMEKIELFQETGIEYISDWLADMALYYRSILTNNEPILFVFDSIAAADSVESINEYQTDSSAKFGKRAAVFGQMLSLRNEFLYDLGVTSIFVNQLRDNVGASKFEDPNKTPGGKSMAFYASIRLGFYGGKAIKGRIKGKEKRVGRHVSIRCVKNKVSVPRETIKASEFYNNLDYHEVGFNKYFGLAELLLDVGVVESNSGGTFTYKGKKIVRGKDAFDKLLLEDDKLRAKLLRKAKVNTISTTRKKIESLTENLYPVEGKTFETQTNE